MKDIHIVRHTAQSRGLLLELSRREGLWTLLVLNNCFQMTVDYSLPVSSIRGSLWARILEWVAMSSSRGSSQPRDQTRVSWISCIAGRFFPTEPPTGRWWWSSRCYWDAGVNSYALSKHPHFWLSYEQLNFSLRGWWRRRWWAVFNAQFLFLGQEGGWVHCLVNAKGWSMPKATSPASPSSPAE